MRQHTQNLFRVDNLNDLDFNYRLVDIDLSLKPEDSADYNTAIQKIRMKVASIIEGPAAIIYRDKKHYIAIPVDKSLNETKVKTSPFIAKVKSLDEEYCVDTNNLTDDNVDIVQKFLDWSIRKQLKDTYDLWSLNSSQFFLKAPLTSLSSRSVDVYGGFKYRLERLADGFFYIVLDLSYKYLDKQYLSAFINVSNKDIIGKSFRGKKCLYQNGDNWYQIEIEGFGKPINEHPVLSETDPRTVLQYIQEKNHKNAFKVDSLLNPKDLALLYKYPGRNMEPHCGATSLAKIVFTNNDPEVRSLHKGSIKTPEKKFESIKANIGRFFQTLSFKNKRLDISKNAVVESEKFFPIPALKFNKGQVLKNTVNNSDFGKDRKTLICNNGILSQTEFDTQYLIVPDKMDKDLVNVFKSHAEGYLKKLTPLFQGFRLVTYKAEPHLSATMQVKNLETKLNELNIKGGFALFILPDFQKQNARIVNNFHDFLKNKFYPELKFQCASASKIKSYYEATNSTQVNKLHEYRVIGALEGRYKSYLFNLVMEYLLINKKWPYALEQNCNYDVYIGIDVHDRYAGFTFFYKNGEHLFFDYERVPKKSTSSRSEKLKRDLILKKIQPKLQSQIPKYAPNPNGIIIIRDGRSFDEETIALRDVIKNLVELNIVEATINWGVVDLHKTSSIPFRIASVSNGYQKLENPCAGSYKLFNSNEGFLFNTGYPFNIPGTAKPLHLILRDGTVNFNLVMHDIFKQSMLAFSAPDRSNSLPITIKLIDSFLEPLAFEEEEIEEDAIEEDEVEEKYIG